MLNKKRRNLFVLHSSICSTILSISLSFALSSCSHLTEEQKESTDFINYLNKHSNVFENRFKTRIEQTRLFLPMHQWLVQPDHKMLFLIYDMCRADGIIEASKQNINQSAFRQLPHRYLGKTMPNCDTRTVSALMAYLVGCPYIDLCAPNTHMFKDKTIHTLLYTYAITHPDCKTSWIDDYEKVAVDIWPDVTKLDSPPLINHLSLTEFLIHLPIWISK